MGWCFYYSRFYTVISVSLVTQYVYTYFQSSYLFFVVTGYNVHVYCIHVIMSCSFCPNCALDPVCSISCPLEQVCNTPCCMDPLTTNLPVAGVEHVTFEEFVVIRCFLPFSFTCFQLFHILNEKCSFSDVNHLE